MRGLSPIVSWAGQGHEPLGVTQVALDGPRTQESGLTRRDQDLSQCFRAYRPSLSVSGTDGLGQPAGAMTM